MANIIVQTFKKRGFGKLRTIEKDGETWFAGKDVSDALGYSETNAMTKRLDSEDFMSAKLEGMNMKQTVISESGLFSAIIGSQLPKAREYKHWVTSEVLPAIHRTGAYITDKADPEMLREKANENEKLADVNVLAQTVLPTLTEAGMKPEFRLMALKQLYRKANIDIPTYGVLTDQEIFSPMQIAAKLGMYSPGGKPHNKAVLSIIDKLKIPESEKVLTPYENKGHSGTTYQYASPVIPKVEGWLKKNKYPAEIQFSSKAGRVEHCHIVYKEGARA